MRDRLHRTRLLFGDAGIEKLQKANVMIVGCGAVGSFAVEALARAGVGNLIIIDSDVIEESNINRQIFATDITIEMPKVDVARARIHDINPDILVTAIRTFFDDSTELNVTPDFVIDAIDTVPSKIALYKWCVAQNIPFISSMGAARKTNPSCIKIAKLSKTTVCPLAAKIRKMVRDAKLPDFDVVYSTEPAAPTDAARVFGSIVTVTGIFGLMAANHAINYIINH